MRSKKEGKVCFTKDERAVSGPSNSFFMESGLRISCVCLCC